MDDQSNTPTDNTSSPLATLLGEITNESGQQKYETPEKALEALKHSQDYIPTLKAEVEQKDATLAAKDAELAELKAKLEGMQSVEDVVNKLKQTEVTPVEQTPEPQTQGVTLEDVKAFLQQQEQESVAQTNANQVASHLRQTFGEQSTETVAKKLGELGMSEEAYVQLTKSSPQAAIALVGGASQAPASPHTGSVHIPPRMAGEPAPVGRPEKSLMVGASMKEQVAHLHAIREEVYRKHGITE